MMTHQIPISWNLVCFSLCRQYLEKTKRTVSCITVRGCYGRLLAATILLCFVGFVLLGVLRALVLVLVILVLIFVIHDRSSNSFCAA